MAYPVELFSKMNVRSDLFKCQKDGQEILLLGTFHAIPFAVLPSDYVAILKTAKRVYLETSKRGKITEAELIADGFLSPEPQGKAFDEQWNQLSPTARNVLENMVKKLSENGVHISLNRIKLDLAF